MVSEWRTRKRGTPRQIGKRFKVEDVPRGFSVRRKNVSSDGLTREELARLRRIHSRRKPHAVQIDDSLRARLAKSPEEWIKSPNRTDYLGVDFPVGKASKSKLFGKEAIATYVNTRTGIITDIYPTSKGGFWERDRNYKGKYISGSTRVLDRDSLDSLKDAEERGIIKFVYGKIPKFEKIKMPNRRIVVFWDMPNGKIIKEEKDFHVSDRPKILREINELSEKRKIRPLITEYSLYTKGEYKGFIKKKLKHGFL